MEMNWNVSVEFVGIIEQKIIMPALYLIKRKSDSVHIFGPHGRTVVVALADWDVFEFSLGSSG